MFRLLALLAASGVMAHEGMFHPAMYGWGGKEDKNIVAPMKHLNFDQWWFHGNLDLPPEEGQMLEIPSGGTITGHITCGVDVSFYGSGPPEYKPGENYHSPDHKWPDMVCETGVHGGDNYEDNKNDPKDLKGCSIGIAYQSDPLQVKPEEVVVISTNHSCAWWESTDFSFPPDLPPCPEGGCHCFWGWVHSAAPGAGAPDEMYHVAYRCNVTNANPDACPLPTPKPARKCPHDKNNCTVGAKSPIYWMQNEGNNNFQDGGDPPFYNDEYGFMDGPQLDLWLADVDHSEYDDTNTTQWAPNSGATYGADYEAPAETAYTKAAPTSISSCAGHTATAVPAPWITAN